MRRFFLPLSVILFVFFAYNAYALNLIENGTFDDGLNNWNVNGDVVIGTDGYANMDGNYALLGSVTNSGDPEVLSQTFYINPGVSSLNVSFDLLITGTDRAWTYDDDVDVILSTLQLESFWMWTWEEWDDTTIYSWESSNGFYNVQVGFTGTILIGSDLVDENPNAELKFILDEDSLGCLGDKTISTLYLDNIVVDDGATAPVPEPATMLLLGTGLVGLAVGSRKKIFKKK